MRDSPLLKQCRAFIEASRKGGDVHGFGQGTRSATEANQETHEKVRSLWHEWFFFGKDSPLRPILGLSDDISQSIFALETHIRVPHGVGWQHGRGCVHHLPNRDPLLNEDVGVLRNFGALCAFAALFGLNDLLLDNVVIRGSNVHVVDCEGAFYQNPLSYSGLLPMVDGLPSPIEYIWELTGADADKLSAMLEGYSATADRIVGNWPAIQRLIASTFQATWSVRRLVRMSEAYWQLGTAHFQVPSEKVVQIQTTIEATLDPELVNAGARLRSALSHTSAFDSALFPEEVLQLQRGDIPIFWLFPYGSDSSHSLYFPASPNGELERVRSPELDAMGCGSVWNPHCVSAQEMLERARRGFFELASWSLSLARVDNLTFEGGNVSKKGSVFRANLSGEKALAVEAAAAAPLRARVVTLVG